ncbi:MAG: N-acetylmuramoyl-L-alanine amidase [Syntrophobacteraceae bacterium]
MRSLKMCRQTNTLHARYVFSLLLLCVLMAAWGCTRTIEVAGPTACPLPDRTCPPGSSPSAPPGAAKVVERCLTNMGGPKTITHEVAPLETVWRISRMYDVPVEGIYRANGLKPNESLRIGQRLTIPNAKQLRHVISLYPNPQWKYIIVHHTATDIGKALQVDRAHHDRGFWNGIGYHFLIDNGTLGKGDGQIEVSPRWIKQQVGAHCKAGGMNDKGIGIALVGNFNEDVPTQNQVQSLTYLIKTLSQYYNISLNNVMGHRDVEGASTDCPGKRFPWSNVRQCLTRP